MTLSDSKFLYKYRPVNAFSLQALAVSDAFFSSPNLFNDPLDCKPGITDSEMDLNKVEKLCETMLGEKRQSTKYERESLESIRARSYEYGSQGAQEYRQGLINEVKRLLYDEMSRFGVLSLAKKWNCPLMWSHYADRHRGLCIEYNMSNIVGDAPRPVRYNQPRSISLRSLYAWKVDGSGEHETQVFETFFFSKAPAWHYEKEWRVLSEPQGAQSHHFFISAVYFGMRMQGGVKMLIGSALSKNDPNVRFYDVVPGNNDFELRRREVDSHYLDVESADVNPERIFKDIPVAKRL